MKSHKILIMFVMFSLFIIPMINATEFETHKRNTNFSLTVSSNNATSCNWTHIELPDGNTINQHVVMTKFGNVFIKNISAGNFTQLGDTCMGVTCTDGASLEVGSVCREITPTGYKMDTSKSILSLVAIALMVITFSLFLVLTVAFNHVGTKIFLLGLSLTTAVFTVGYVLQMLKDNVGEFSSFTSVFSSFYVLLTILLIGASLALILYFVWFGLTLFNRSRGLID